MIFADFYTFSGI